MFHFSIFPPCLCFPTSKFLCCCTTPPAKASEKWGPRQILSFLIPPLRRETLSERLGEGRGERRKITSSFEQERNSGGGGGVQSYPLRPRLIPAGGNWLHKQGSPLLALLHVARLCQTCSNLDYRNSSEAFIESLTCTGQAMFTLCSPPSLYNTGSHVVVNFGTAQLNWAAVPLHNTGGQQRMTGDRQNQYSLLGIVNKIHGYVRLKECCRVYKCLQL